MARKPKANPKAEFLMFDVLYDDGSRSSNRRVPQADLDGLDVDDTARAIIEAQDREIAEKSGRPRGRIKSLSRSPVR
ncbi:MAG: hypothetical protein HQL38_12330 [Alphaproteobacteria bacterium]|nr:hypothetical protein [Alphaproteobacteria bacterium]MBF0393457.1 hypothetical protein [Alphaproteobacteria bacterium]